MTERQRYFWAGFMYGVLHWWRWPVGKRNDELRSQWCAAYFKRRGWDHYSQWSEEGAFDSDKYKKG